MKPENGSDIDDLRDQGMEISVGLARKCQGERAAGYAVSGVGLKRRLRAVRTRSGHSSSRKSRDGEVFPDASRTWGREDDVGSGADGKGCILGNSQLRGGGGRIKVQGKHGQAAHHRAHGPCK